MKVTISEDNILVFDNGLSLHGGVGEQSCCEYNFLDFESLPEGTEFETMNAEQMAKAITMKKDGFIMKDIEGTPKWVQARSEQNGYYASITTLCLNDGKNEIKLGDFEGELI